VPEKEEGDNWDSHWERYAAAANLNPAQRMRHNAILAALRHEKLPTPRLLDVGSGQGDFLARAATVGAAQAYAGFELSQSGISVSRSKIPQAEFVALDLVSPSSDADRFTGWATVAVCSEVVEHVDDPVAFLATLRRYLAEDAVLVLTVPGGPMSKFDHHIGHRRHFTRTQTRQVLERAGFRVNAVRLIGFPFFNLYRLLVILRGQQLVNDVDSKNETGASGPARLAMQAFDFLFRFSLKDSPLGWQVLAIARKASA